MDLIDRFDQFRFDQFLGTLTPDETLALFDYVSDRLLNLEAPEITVVADPEETDPDDDSYVVPTFYCPKCELHGVEVSDVDMSIRHCRMDADTYADTDEFIIGSDADTDNDNHGLYYFCETGSHVVRIDPNIDIIY